MGAGGMLSGSSQPATRYALSTVPIPAHFDGSRRWCYLSWRRGGHKLGKEKSVSQPGLQVTGQTRLVGWWSHPPQSLHQGEPATTSLPAPNTQG